LPRKRTGPYQLQAAIAALHDEAASAEATDWPQIKALYELLLQISDNPIIALNHAVAVAMVDGATSGLQRLEALATNKQLAEDHRLFAVLAHLLEMSGETAAACEAYRAARPPGKQPAAAALSPRAGRASHPKLIFRRGRFHGCD
jgi:predicted RNA polymerase sigma factor